MPSDKKSDKMFENTKQHLIDFQNPDTASTAGKRPWRTEDEMQSYIERQIQRAMDDGAFENLPGKGRPLELAPSHGDPTLDMAHRILKNNNVAPEWIERDKEIRQRVDAMRTRLRENPRAENWVVDELAAINRKIDDFNLSVPILSKQKRRLSLNDERLSLLSHSVGFNSSTG